MDLYKAYHAALNPQTEIVIYKPKPFITFKQRGVKDIIYIIDKNYGLPGGKLFGKNFISELCRGTSLEKINENIIDKHYHISYDSATDTYLCGKESENIDFLFYLIRYAKREPINYFICSDNNIILTKNIYDKYNLNGIIFYINEIIASKKHETWCTLF
jgi:hypothetical protein